MGIKEFEHLKKSLSEISSKTSNLKISEKKINGLNKELVTRREEIKDSQSNIQKWQKEINKQLEKVQNTSFRTRWKTELAEIREEIYQIESEMEQKDKRMTMRKQIYIIPGEEHPIVAIIGFSMFFIIGGAVPGFWDGTSEYWDVFCCGYPIGILIILQVLTTRKFKSELLDSETIKRYKSLKKKESYRWRKIKKHQDEKTWQEELEGKQQFHIERNRKNSDRIETILASIKDTEQLIVKLNKDIEEIYESIKHLIPYSEYL